jgi:hypothetical protein
MPVNICQFSACRSYRYTLLHSFRKESDEFIGVDLPPEQRRQVMWIGLNPSTADEQRLDPTLRRVRGFSHQWGFNTFIMTNVFAFRATLPKDMRKAPDPIGSENDRVLIETARACEHVVACWGGLSNFPRSLRHRAASIRIMLRDAGRPVQCLGCNDDGSPKHPLYLDATTPLVPLQP